MNITISLLNFRPGKIGGTETVLRKLLAHAPVEAGADRLTALVTPENRDGVDPAAYRLALLDRSDRRMVVSRLLEAFSPWRARRAERLLRRTQPDVTLFPQQAIYPKRAEGPAVLVVHDLQHLFLPHLFSRVHRAFRAAIYDYSLRRADRVIAISQFTRRTLIERYGLDEGQIAVVPHGFDPQDVGTVEPWRGADGPYLYYPAASFPHKGHAALIETFAALRRRGGFDYRLVFTGMQTPHWRRLAARIDALGIARDVHHLGFVPYQQVLSIYRGAAAVVLPTQFEGFGLPVLEAVQFGKKVIASRLEVFDEIGLGREWQIDFFDPDQLAGALDRDEATTLQRQPWTWRDSARAVLDVLRQVAQG
jgi:glycosyltransferase involved in cell wall biosynthesis